MNKRNTFTVLSKKERAPELGHRIDPHQQFRQPFHQQRGYSYCKSCGAINFQKHWYADRKHENALRQEKSAQPSLCPGCQRVEEEAFEGEIILNSKRISTELGDMIALIKHTEGKCWHDNPLARIGAAAQEGEEFQIFTTTRGLAIRIGKALRKAFKGTLEVKRTPGERFVRVYWTD